MGLEPLTPSLQMRCSSQLSYEPAIEHFAVHSVRRLFRARIFLILGYEGLCMALKIFCALKLLGAIQRTHNVYYSRTEPLL